MNPAPRRFNSTVGFARDGLRRWRARFLSSLPRLAYVGWVGHRNLGDEAMFEAIRQLMHPCRLVPYGSEARETMFRRLGLSGRRFFHAVLLGGGTLVNPGFWPPVRILASEEIPMAMFGTGVGSSGFGQAPAVPVETWSSIAHRFFAVGVRGPDSRRQLVLLGFKDVEIIGDPALSLAVDTLPPAPANPARLILNLAGEPDAEFLEELAGFLAQITANGGVLIGVALCAQDTPVFDRLFAIAGAPRFEVVKTDRDWSQYMRLVSGARAVLAVRLHAAVLACAAGTPPLLFSYRAKCRDFMDSMELGDYLLPWSREGCARLRERWVAVESDFESLRRNIFERAHAWRSAQARFARKVLRELRASGHAAPRVARRGE